MHYGSCNCSDGRLDKIDVERKQIAKRLEELAAEEKSLLTGTLTDLGIIGSAAVPPRLREITDACPYPDHAGWSVSDCFKAKRCGCADGVRLGYKAHTKVASGT